MTDANFNLVMGSGHNGSKWFARVLDAQMNVHARHEHRMAFKKSSWTDAHRFAANHTANTPYWRDVARSCEWGIDFYDVNSWMPWEVTEINVMRPIHRVVYLVRNGIVQLESLMNCCDTWRSDGGRGSWQWNTWLRNFWNAEEMRRCRDGAPLWQPLRDFDDMNRFEKLCLLVAGNHAWPEWLIQHPDVHWLTVVRLEDLTTDWARLAEFVHMKPDDLIRLQSFDINRHNPNDRDPAAIWAKWPTELRDAFRSICTVTMDEHGYKIPAD